MPELSDVERENWASFIGALGVPLSKALLNSRGYNRFSEIDSVRRQSIMVGMASDVRDGFRHQHSAVREQLRCWRVFRWGANSPHFILDLIAWSGMVRVKDGENDDG